VKTIVDYLKKHRPNAIYLNAGDNFQGTFWYNLLRYNVTAHFLNLIPADAIVLGNHEFAHRTAGLIPFMKSLTSPVVIANMDDRNDKHQIHKLYQKSIIVERENRKIGIIGVIMREASEIANTDNLRFTNEIDAIRNESTKLRQNGVNIIIVLSHCGIDRDREIAREAGDFVDIIVGGHSHQFFYTSKDGNFPGNVPPVGSYPVIELPKSGADRKVLIVHTPGFTKFIGDLTVYFNADGHVKYYDGNPIYLADDIKKDSIVDLELIPWRDEVNRLGVRDIGYTNVNLMHQECRHGECTLGSFTADAFVHETKLELPHHETFVAIIQSAGMRNSFRKGNITFSDINAFMPFENTLDIVELNGETIRSIFEHSISRSYVDYEFIGVHMLQISGIKVAFNTTKPVGQRVQSLQIKINNFDDYENVQSKKFYSLIAPSFLVNGGDGFTMIKLKKKNHRIGLLDIDIMEKYIARKSPITSASLDNRIVMLT
jgi:5'-nucleotidase